MLSTSIKSSTADVMSRRMDFEQFFERAVVGMCRRDADGTFRAANAALLELLGVGSLDELHSMSEGVPDQPDEHAALMRRLLEARRLCGWETTWRKATGEAVPVRISAVLLMDADGRPVGFDATVEDATPLIEANQALQDALEKAHYAAQAKSQFLANLSHEVRTPLTAILGFASVLAKELPPETQRHAALIEKSGRRLIETMDAVLTYANLEADGQTLTSETVNVASVARTVVQDYELRAVSKGLDLTVREESDGPFDALADEAALARALKNLVSNAIKFTDEGGVEVVIRRDDANIVVDVADTGIGIDPAFLPRAFEPFRQESTGMARSHQGTGIGLAIAQRLARMMNARVDARSARGEGSTFSFIIPALGAAAPETETSGTVDKGTC